jgi:hypothetical protein
MAANRTGLSLLTMLPFVRSRKTCLVPPGHPCLRSRRQDAYRLTGWHVACLYNAPSTDVVEVTLDATDRDFGPDWVESRDGREMSAGR